MSQATQNIPSQAGAAYRAAVNAALQAIIGNNSGPTPPTELYPYMEWADTSTNLLKQRNGANTAWISVSDLTTGLPVGALALVGGNMTGGINEALSTVASAATPDIWTGTGNKINYTGTTAATGFAAAPQAGASRSLICVGACSFTYGANMLIDGGVSFNAAAGDIVDVIAVTATQFRLKPRKADGTPVVASASTGLLIGFQLYSVVTQTPTISIASPGVVTSPSADKLPLNDTPIVFTTTGALPTGLTASQTYWVINAAAGGVTFNVAATKGGAAINTSGAQSGTHTANNPTYNKATNNPSFVISELWGAGGAGLSAAIGAGAAGGYSRKKTLATSLAASETVTVGAGGNAGAGGTSSFGSWHSATGGAIGLSAQPGSVGGIGVGGDFNLQGASGVLNAGSPVMSAPLIGTFNNAQAAAGVAYPGRNNTGMGGTGGSTGSTLGGSGLVIITEYK